MRRRFILWLMLCLMLFLVPVKADNVVALTSLQQRLLSLGYEIGTADGILGTKTKSALLLAQTLLSDAGFEVSSTGQPDAVTAALIMKEENSTLLRTLLKGSWGSRVREAQEKLINLNLLRDSADGTEQIQKQQSLRLKICYLIRFRTFKRMAGCQQRNTPY